MLQDADELSMLCPYYHCIDACTSTHMRERTVRPRREGPIECVHATNVCSHAFRVDPAAFDMRSVSTSTSFGVSELAESFTKLLQVFL